MWIYHQSICVDTSNLLDLDFQAIIEEQLDINLILECNRPFDSEEGKAILRKKKISTKRAASLLADADDMDFRGLPLEDAISEISNVRRDLETDSELQDNEEERGTQIPLLIDIDLNLESLLDYIINEYEGE